MCCHHYSTRVLLDFGTQLVTALGAEGRGAAAGSPTGISGAWGRRGRGQGWIVCPGGEGEEKLGCHERVLGSALADGRATAGISLEVIQ